MLTGAHLMLMGIIIALSTIAFHTLGMPWLRAFSVSFILVLASRVIAGLLTTVPI